jgi:hypothetical protein
MSEKNRGEYCRTYKACRALKSFVLNPDVCLTCTAYDPIFKNVDPLKFHKVLFQKPISEKEKPVEKIVEETKEKICTKCNEPKPADKKHFFANKKTDDGLCGWCKVCHNNSSKKNKQPVKAKSIKKPIEKKPVENDPIEKKSQKKTSPVLDENSPVLTIDFTGHEKLLTNLQEHAAKKFRTPGNQLLYWLANYELELVQK